MALWTNADLVKARKTGISRDGTLYGVWATNFATVTKPGSAASDDLEDRFLSDGDAVAALVAAKALTPERGQAITDALAFDRYLVMGRNPMFGNYAASLATRSFLLTFKNADIARLLAATSKFAANPNQRIVDTAQRMGPVMIEQDYCLAATYLLGVDHRGYNSTVPSSLYVNQVSLAYTLLTFSATPLMPIPADCGGDGTKTYVKVKDPNYRDQFVRFWNVIGSMLGIENGGLPTSFAEATALFTLLDADSSVRETDRSAGEGKDSAYPLARDLFRAYLKKNKAADDDPDIVSVAGDLVRRWPKKTA